MSEISMLYVFETTNESAVGPFADRPTAEAWMLRVVPPEDQDELSGYRIGTLEEVNEHLSDPQFETPDAAEGRYRECYEEFYPNFRFRR
jgi:hypothetical protein